MEWPTRPDGLFCSQNNQSSRLVASPLFHPVAPSHTTKATRAARESPSGIVAATFGVLYVRNVKRNQTSIELAWRVCEKERERLRNKFPGEPFVRTLSLQFFSRQCVVSIFLFSFLP